MTFLLTVRSSLQCMGFGVILMDPIDRRKMIIQEIAYWRHSKILPEHYCDFLLNLYQDEHSEAASASAQSSWRSAYKSSISNSHWRTWTVVSLIVLAACLLIINFKHLPTLLQLIVSLIIVATCYFAGIKKLRQSHAASYAYLGIGSIVLLWSGQYMLKAHGFGESMWLVSYLFLCVFIWIAMGISLNLGLLQFCGLLGMVMLYGWFIHSQIDDMHWLSVQLFWLPLTLFFIWIGWLSKRLRKPTGFIYCLIGLLLWFVPDGYLIVVSEQATIWMQLLLALKIGVTVFIMYVFRKKWTEWVV